MAVLGQHVGKTAEPPLAMVDTRWRRGPVTEKHAVPFWSVNPTRGRTAQGSTIFATLSYRI
jgi:hypothetical protein